MNRFDESIAILNGQIETHKQKIQIANSEIEKRTREIAGLEQQKHNFEDRIISIRTVVDQLLILKAQGD